MNDTISSFVGFSLVVIGIVMLIVPYQPLLNLIGLATYVAGAYQMFIRTEE